MTRPIVKTIQSLLDQSYCFFIQRSKTNLATSSTVASSSIRKAYTRDLPTTAMICRHPIRKSSFLNPINSTTGSNVVQPNSRPMKTTGSNQHNVLVNHIYADLCIPELATAFWYVVKPLLPFPRSVPKVLSHDGKACKEPNIDVSLLISPPSE
jgi:hypothetical protein